MSREKLSVWIGLCGNGELIGPFFFDGYVNGEAYLQMLNDQIVRALAEHYVLQANGNFLEGMVGARRNPGSSQDSGDGTSSAAVSGPHNFAGS